VLREPVFTSGAPDGFADDEVGEISNVVVPPPPSAPTGAAPPKQDAPAPRKSRGFGLGALVDKLKKAVTPGGGARRLVAKLLRQHGTRLDLELVVDATLDWVPAKDAIVELADGTTVKAQVNFSFTTANGVYGPGLVLTLTLTLPGEVESPTLVQLVSAGQNVEVVISG
jgi:hypothetical protein